MDEKEREMEESLEKIMELLVEKKYFLARDELLKFNEVDIAELLEDIIDDSGIRMAVILFRLLPKDISVNVLDSHGLFLVLCDGRIAGGKGTIWNFLCKRYRL